MPERSRALAILHPFVTTNAVPDKGAGELERADQRALVNTPITAIAIASPPSPCSNCATT